MAYPLQTIIEATIKYRANSQILMNVVHYNPQTLGAGDIQDLVQSFLNKFADLDPASLLGKMIAGWSQDVELIQVGAQMVYPQRWRKLTLPFLINGGVAQPCSRQNTALTITKVGLKANRHNVGSFHWGGLPDTAFALGEVEPGFLPALGGVQNALKQQVIDAAAGITYDPVIINHTKVIVDGKPKYPISGYSLMSDAFLQLSARTMYRRTKGIGI